jgi:hypothetical protein
MSLEDLEYEVHDYTVEIWDTSKPDDISSGTKTGRTAIEVLMDIFPCLYGVDRLPDGVKIDCADSGDAVMLFNDNMRCRVRKNETGI